MLQIIVSEPYTGHLFQIIICQQYLINLPAIDFLFFSSF